MTDLVKISPSQINAWHDPAFGCPSRWWYDRNRPRVQHPAAQYGTDVHQVLEDYQAIGKAPDLTTREGLTAVAGLGLLSPPRTAQVEISMSFAHDRVLYNGRIDFCEGYVPRKHVIVGDHKTIGTLSRHKTEAELLDDPQRILYSYWAMHTYRVDAVTARWIYYQRVTQSKKAGEAKAVQFTESAGDIAERFHDLHQKRGLPILDAKLRELTPPDLEKNLGACHMFPPHGCPHKTECHKTVSPLDIIAAAVCA